MNSGSGKFAAILFCLAGLAGLGGCDLFGDDNRPVGQLESDRIEISAEFAEPIVEWRVIEGQAVQQGATLIVQNTARIETRIAEAEAVLGRSQAVLDELIRGPRRERIVAAQANVRGAEDDVEFRIAQYQRASELLERELAAPDIRDQAKAALDNANAALEFQRAQLEELLTGTTVEELSQAEESVRQAQAALAALMVDLSRHELLAPTDGIVDSILFEPGERPPAAAPVIVMLSGTQPYARTYVPAAMRVHVGPGTRARVFVDGLSSPLDGTVRWVASEAAFTPYFALTEHDRGRLSFLAKVDLADTGNRLPDGVPVEVEFLTGAEP